PNPATLTILDNDGSASSGHTFYQYDKLGNLLSKTGVGSYSYGANGNGTGAGPHQARSVGGQTYQYDANGNLLSGGGRSYTWDHENRPTQIISNTVTENYTYDGDGERISRASGGTTTIYLGGLWEETTAGVITSYYSFNGATIAQRTSSGVTFLHGDHLGSVSMASGAGGASAGTQAFDAWGQISSGGISASSLNYTGQRRDSGTGLLYYHTRYHDPVLARFVSADTMTPDPSNPQDLNRYAYVHDNPIRYIDPTGHCLGWLWNDASCRPIWQTGAPPSYGDALDVVQTGLDVVGMVPAVGEAADLAMPASRPQEATRPVRRSRYHMAVGIQGMGIDRLQLER
ncbi:MAG TPA: RHS repeat-associated core domain-containing protein, partial [Roseiflexaceae bacterium]|nr:RHS repeat-associated core domain-containing protein [Roseiflexaceae bacterium]